MQGLRKLVSDEEEMTDNENLQLLAANTVWEILCEGAKKARPRNWPDESPDMHLDKALRHALTYRLIRDGHQAPDGEDHLKLALTRMAMALYASRVD